MNQILYIITVGLNPIEGTLNLGPLKTAMYRKAPSEIHSIHILMDPKEEEKLEPFFSDYPLLEKKTIPYEINRFEYESILGQILEIYKDYNNLDVNFIVNVTGGTKVMSLGAFMGASLIGARMHYVKENKKTNETEISGDEESEILDILLPRMPIIEMHDIQKAILHVLKTRKNEQLKQPQVMKIINKEKEYEHIKIKDGQTMNYHCNILQNNDIIRRFHDEENQRAWLMELTRIGKSIAILFDLN